MRARDYEQAREYAYFRGPHVCAALFFSHRRVVYWYRMHKTNLHFHSAEDGAHAITYSLYEGIDQAVRDGFNVLAVTCHRAVVATQDHIAYAREQGLLLISGIEAEIYEGRKRSHVLILNCDRQAETLRTFHDLAAYRASHPDIFVIAPHPYHTGSYCLHDMLERYIHLFDAIERSWFYSRAFDQNRRAEAVARAYNKPYIATSDTHFFDYWNESYALIDTASTPEDVFRAIRQRAFENVSTPRALVRDMIIRMGSFMLVDTARVLIRRLRHAYNSAPAPIPSETLAPAYVEARSSGTGTSRAYDTGA